MAVPAHTHLHTPLLPTHMLWSTSGLWYIYSTVFLTENADCIFCHCFTWAQSCNSIDLGPNPAHLKMSLHLTFDLFNFSKTKLISQFYSLKAVYPHEGWMGCNLTDAQLLGVEDRSPPISILNFECYTAKPLGFLLIKIHQITLGLHPYQSIRCHRTLIMSKSTSVVHVELNNQVPLLQCHVEMGKPSVI